MTKIRRIGEASSNSLLLHEILPWSFHLLPIVGPFRVIGYRSHRFAILPCFIRILFSIVHCIHLNNPQKTPPQFHLRLWILRVKSSSLHVFAPPVALLIYPMGTQDCVPRPLVSVLTLHILNPYIQASVLPPNRLLLPFLSNHHLHMVV